jgi:hypothetical protein
MTRNLALRSMLFALALVSGAGCTRPEAVQKVAELSHQQLAAIRASTAVRQEVLALRNAALGAEITSLQTNGLPARIYVDSILADWRVEQAASNLRLVEGIRAADVGLREDPFQLVRQPATTLSVPPPPDISGLDKTLAGLDVMRDPKSGSAESLILFGRDVLKALNEHSKNKPGSSAGSNGNAVAGSDAMPTGN